MKANRIKKNRIPDSGVLEDFTTYLEKLISEHRAEKGKTAGSIILEEKEVYSQTCQSKIHGVFQQQHTENKPTETIDVE